jgi:hypothetical protein
MITPARKVAKPDTDGAAGQERTYDPYQADLADP